MKCTRILVVLTSVWLFLQPLAWGGDGVREGVRHLAGAVAATVDAKNIRSLAVIPFRKIDGHVTLLGVHLSEELIPELDDWGLGDRIVERAELNDLLQEMKLGESGVIDPKTAARVGKVLGAEAIVIGTISDLDRYFEVVGKLVDVQTGRVMRSSRFRVAATAALRRLNRRYPQSQDAGSGGNPEGNLIVNGSFDDDWDKGWIKYVQDPTQGNLTVSRTDGGQVYMILRGANAGQIYQSVNLGSAGLEGLTFECGVKLIPHIAPAFIKKPVTTAIVLELKGRKGETLGTIWLSRSEQDPLAGLPLRGTPQKSIGSAANRCVEQLGDGWNRVHFDLDRKARDCLATIHFRRVRSVLVGCLLVTGDSSASAEAYLDDVKLYYRGGD